MEEILYQPMFPRLYLVYLIGVYPHKKQWIYRILWRVVMKLDPKIAPVLAVVCPLVKKDGLPEIGRKIMDILKKDFKVLYDQQGSIGKRYYRQDEAGTPFGITVDHQSIDDQSVTLRHRDTQRQDRIAIDQLVNAIKNKLENFHE